MTVLDTSGVIDFLLGSGANEQVEAIFRLEGVVSAPDVITFEVIAAFRRQYLRGVIDASRAGGLVSMFGELSVSIFPAMPLRLRCWELRDRLTAADALFVALAEALGEPLATKDQALAGVASDVGVDVVSLG